MRISVAMLLTGCLGAATIPASFFVAGYFHDFLLWWSGLTMGGCGVWLLTQKIIWGEWLP